MKCLFTLAVWQIRHFNKKCDGQKLSLYFQSIVNSVPDLHTDRHRVYSQIRIFFIVLELFSVEPPVDLYSDQFDICLELMQKLHTCMQPWKGHAFLLSKGYFCQTRWKNSYFNRALCCQKCFQRWPITTSQSTWFIKMHLQQPSWRMHQIDSDFYVYELLSVCFLCINLKLTALSLDNIFCTNK